jgi:hypothetical protein
VAAIQKELDAEYLNSNGNNGSSTSGCLVKQHVFSSILMFTHDPLNVECFKKDLREWDERKKSSLKVVCSQKGYTVKRLSIFPSPAGMSLTKLSHGRE